MTEIATDRAIAELKDIYNNELEFKDEITIMAFDEAIEALEKSDKYRWHDLRKNPGDLPVEFKDVLVEKKYMTDPRTTYYDVVSYTNDLYQVDEYDFYQEKGVAGFYDLDSEYGYIKISNVIKWKYIEPSEEVEE